MIKNDSNLGCLQPLFLLIFDGFILTAFPHFKARIPLEIRTQKH